MGELDEQREFLRRSIDDLEREREAGDISAQDYAALKQRYEARAESVDRALAEHEELPAPTATAGPARRGRLIATIAVVLIVAGLAGYLVTQSAGRRGAGESVSGDVRTTIRSKLDDAVLAGEKGELVAAFDLYAAVLEEQPTNVEALAYRGWFIGRTGELDRGADLIGQALDIDPHYGDAKVFLAYVTSTRGDDAGAVTLLDEAADDGLSAYATAYATRLRSELEAG